MTPTPEELAKASRYLSETRDGLEESIAGLSTAQWNFKPAPDRWSVAETVEHIVMVEIVVQGIVCNIGSAPEPPADWVGARADEAIPAQVPTRSTKLTAPPHLIPSQHWSHAEALARFRAARERTVELLYGPSLRGRVAPHPVFGLWDGYQWLLAAAAHSARHTRQIHETKAEPHFPLASSAAASN